MSSRGLNLIPGLSIKTDVPNLSDLKAEGDRAAALKAKSAIPSPHLAPPTIPGLSQPIPVLGTPRVELPKPPTINPSTIVPAPAAAAAGTVTATEKAVTKVVTPAPTAAIVTAAPTSAVATTVAATTQTQTVNSSPTQAATSTAPVILRIPEDRKQFVTETYGKEILNKAYDYNSRKHLGFAGGAEKYLASQPVNQRELIQKAALTLESGHVMKDDTAAAENVRDRTRIVIGNKSEREKFIKGAFGDESKVIFNLIKDMPRAGSDMKGAERLIKKAETPEERLDKNLDKLFSSRLASAKTDAEKQTIQEEKAALKSKVETVKKFMTDGQIDTDVFPKYQAWMTSRYPNSAATLAQPVVEKPAGNDVALQTTYNVKRSGFLGIFGEKKVQRKVEVVDSFAE